jgi:SAM-dependent methyltransferase
VEDISDFLEAVRERDPEEGEPVPALHLDHPDGRFPAVVLFDLVDRLDDEPARILVDEVYRLLQPGGWALALSHSRATGAPEPTLEVVFVARGYRLQETGETPFRRQVRANRDLMRLFSRFGRQQIQLRVDGMRDVLLRRALKR